jgi:hypothetical protein
MLLKYSAAFCSNLFAFSVFGVNEKSIIFSSFGWKHF